MQQHKFLFTYVPKVACTNWKCIFRYMMGADDYLDTKKAHKNDLNGLSFLSNFDDCHQIVNDDSIKKYCFVRNPYSRVLSAYLNKVKPYVDDNTQTKFAPMLRPAFLDMEEFRQQQFPQENNVNLFIFLNWILASEHFQADNTHWLPQTQILNIENVSYTFMGRFENIEHDAGYLLKLMGCDLKFPTQTQIKFSPTGASAKLYEAYSTREIQLVQKIYARDFKLLDYPIHF